MTDFVTILEAETGRCLAKKIHADGRVEDYSAGFLFRPEAVPVASLAELGAVLEALAGDPAFCVIRGRLKDGAESEWVPRRSRDSEEHAADFEAAAHHWVCLDLDASIVAIDAADPRAAIEAWRASLPAPLSTCGMIFTLSAKAGLFPYLRGHAWIWASAPVGDVELRAWCAANDFDPALARAVQPHYTADPIYVDGVDPYAGRRVHTFEGPDADIDWSVVAPAPRTSAAPARVAPSVGAGADVVAALGDARDHEGHRWHLCGALGGVWRRQWRSVEWARATITEWLSTVPGDHTAAVEWCLGAWGMAPEKCTGRAELVTHLGGDVEWAERVAKASARRVAADAGPSLAPAESALVGDPEQPITLSGANHRMWIRAENGYIGPYAHKQMRVVAKKLLGDDARLVLGEGKGYKTYDGLYDDGELVDRIVRTFAERGSRYSSEDATLYQGYSLPEIPPVWNERVAAWLEALAGPMLPNLLDWIALCSQANIGRRAAALVIVGGPDVGKSRTFKCLSQMWGAETFVPLKDAAAKFNASICASPIVCDDEAKALASGIVTSEDFRARVADRYREFEPKGQEKVGLSGYTREGVAANAADAVMIANVYDASTQAAVEKRLCVIRCPNDEAARAALFAIAGGDEDAEEQAIREHFAWVWATHAVTSRERFAAAGGDARSVSLAAVRAEGQDLWESLGALLAGPWEEVPEPVATGWLRWQGELYASPAALAGILAMRDRRWDTAKVTRLVRAVSSGEFVRLRCPDGKRPRFYPLDAALVSSVI